MLKTTQHYGSWQGQSKQLVFLREQHGKLVLGPRQEIEGGGVTSGRRSKGGVRSEAPHRPIFSSGLLAYGIKPKVALPTIICLCVLNCACGCSLFKCAFL